MWETAYKLFAGFGANAIIVGVPTYLAYKSIPEVGTPDIMRGTINRVLGVALASSAGSFVAGNWIRSKPGWRVTGITQMVFSGLTFGFSLYGLYLANADWRIGAGARTAALQKAMTTVCPTIPSRILGSIPAARQTAPQPVLLRR